MTRVEELPTQELINELQRRSLACLIVTVRVENTDVWNWSVKGSPHLVGACCGVLQPKINELLNKQQI